MVLDESLKAITGYRCKNIKMSYPNLLVIYFKDTIISRDNIIELRTISCSWRLSNDQIICGGFDDDLNLQERLNIIIGKELIEIKLINKFDYSFIFSNGYELCLFSNSIEIENFEIITSDNKVIKYLPNEIQYKNACELTIKNEDLIRATIAKEFDNRWSRRVITSASDESCRTCMYFRGIAGDYEFWDYGICSNEKSANDGKLIQINSGCDFYEKTTDMSL